MNAKLVAAQGFFRELSIEISRVPTYSKDEVETTIARAKALGGIIGLIETKGGAVKTGSHGVSVRVFGIRASSTGGLLQACHNWKSQVTLKSMAANMAAQTGGAAW